MKPHPGEILNEDFLIPLNKSMYWLAKGTKINQTAIGQIIKGKRSITPNTALRLGKFLGSGAEFWMRLQNLYDLDKEESKHND
jgi:addiction module HigA family antidote